jgi:itaconate CoA-transferase
MPRARRTIFSCRLKWGLLRSPADRKRQRASASVADIGAGMNAHQAILEALLARERSGEGAEISVSLFDAMAEWMTVPLLSHEGGHPFRRIGLAHAAIAPYGVFKTRDEADILISIQNDREWRVLAAQVLGEAALADDPRFATNRERVRNRAQTDALVGGVFARFDVAALSAMLTRADIAFARVNDCALLSTHPHLRRISVNTPSGAATLPAPAPRFAHGVRQYGPVPRLGEHTEKVRAEFMR